MSIIAREKPQYHFGELKVTPKLSIKEVEDYFKLPQWRAVKYANMRHNGLPVGDSYHILRESRDSSKDTESHGHVLDRLVNESYEVLQYQDGLSKFQPMLDEQLLAIHSSCMFGKGSKFSTLFEIADEIKDTVEGDEVERYLLLALSHGKGYRGLYYTDIVPVCENTLTSAILQGLKTKGKHFTLGQDDPNANLTRGIKLLDLARAKFFEEEIPLYKALSELEITQAQLDYIFRTLINMPINVPSREVSEQLQDRYIGLYDSYHTSPGQEDRKDLTGWKAYNAITHFTHSGLGRSSEKMYEQNLLGAGNRYRKYGKELLTELLPKKFIGG